MTRKVSASKTSGKFAQRPPPKEPAKSQRVAKEAPKTVSGSRKFVGRTFLAERGFQLKEAPAELLSAISDMGWDRLVKHPVAYSVPIVREFYAGIPDADSEGKPITHSMVRCRKVYFNAKAINDILDLDYNGTEFVKRVEGAGLKEMELVKKKLTVEGCKWFKKTKTEFKVKKSTLMGEAKVWYNFVKHSILPTSHTETVDKERLLLLDQILERKPIDIGRLISREILACKDRDRGYLFYPCLINELCVKAEVELFPGEEKHRPLGALPTVVHLKKRSAAASGSEDRLQQFIHQQKAVWQFQKDQFVWQQKLLGTNPKGEQMFEPPQFPDWVLEEELVDEEQEEELEEEQMDEPETSKPETARKEKKSKRSRNKGKKVIISDEEEEFARDEECEEELEEETESQHLEGVASPASPTSQPQTHTPKSTTQTQSSPPKQFTPQSQPSKDPSQAIATDQPQKLPGTESSEKQAVASDAAASDPEGNAAASPVAPEKQRISKKVTRKRSGVQLTPVDEPDDWIPPPPPMPTDVENPKEVGLKKANAAVDAAAPEGSSKDDVKEPDKKKLRVYESKIKRSGSRSSQRLKSGVISN